MLAAANTAADAESPTGRGAEASAAPPPTSKSGWGVDTVKTDASVASAAAEHRRRRNLSETEESKGPDRSRHNAEMEDEVQEIATLDADETENSSSQVAAPPKQSGLRVQTIRELDRSAHYSLPSTSDTGIDLSLLTSVLCPPAQVAEEDTVWTAEFLLTELQLESNAETDGNATPERDEKQPAQNGLAGSRGNSGRISLATSLKL
ncbi:hypothetical protein KFL_000660190 [Klebsormidium nitens]|uniref:Uncharacterized protein n=1 Tax=Klebsormidium nitens TaxID=105231 RepID=A0A1Y1HQK8_KLENI|nr:hypothetical protein KFL_000660190 [Klebsormidium nitens]|eukprot:GAQ80924.1 hypothetical protein KFL_000660190 [Klebsormidium nitens]